MIIMIPVTKFYKKRKKIFPFRNFVIVNATTLPKIRDLPNVMAEHVRDEDGLRMSSIKSLAYQLNDRVFDENVPIRRRNELVTQTFASVDFVDLTVMITAYQIKHPDDNIYIILEDLAYERYIDKYSSTINDFFENPIFDNKIFYTWNSAENMKITLEAQVKKELDEFDVDKWNDEKKNPFYDSYMDLEDDEYDIYLDNKNIAEILEDSTSNKEIRELFIRYAKYTKKQLKAMAKFVKKYSSKAQE